MTTIKINKNQVHLTNKKKISYHVFLHHPAPFFPLLQPPNLKKQIILSTFKGKAKVHRQCDELKGNISALKECWNKALQHVTTINTLLIIIVCPLRCEIPRDIAFIPSIKNLYVCVQISGRYSE